MRAGSQNAGPLKRSEMFKDLPTNSDIPVVDLIYRNRAGVIKHRQVPWKRLPTVGHLKDWILDYYDRVSDGYMPEGCDEAPRPHAAIIYLNGKVMAEWFKPTPRRRSADGKRVVFDLSPKPNPLAESPVTAETRIGLAGKLEVAPSTTTSGDSIASAVNNAKPGRFRSGSGQPVA